MVPRHSLWLVHFLECICCSCLSSAEDSLAAFSTSVSWRGVPLVALKFHILYPSCCVLPRLPSPESGAPFPQLCSMPKDSNAGEAQCQPDRRQCWLQTGGLHQKDTSLWSQIANHFRCVHTFKSEILFGFLSPPFRPDL